MVVKQILSCLGNRWFWVSYGYLNVRFQDVTQGNMEILVNIHIADLPQTLGNCPQNCIMDFLKGFPSDPARSSEESMNAHV